MRNATYVLAVLVAICPLGAFGGSQPDLTIDWTEYHNHADVTRLLKGFAEQYKNISKVYSIGKSFQGKDIWCMEITNYETGAPETKPGMYIDGNTHDGEVSGGETCLYTIEHLLTNYGKDPQATQLIDTKVFYILPKINPDGSDAYLRDPSDPVEPGIKKVDDDKDGLLDEDPDEDLNKDGIISLMRIRDENGTHKTSPKDARLMVERGAGEKADWRILGSEGLDNDGDGKINEDPYGMDRTVSNRNYPAYWAPDWVQDGSGVYPLSEPEARAQVDFVLAHPNIAGMQAFHTHCGVLLRPYCNRGDEHIPPEDMRAFEAIAAIGTELTGYPLLSVYNDFTTDKTNPRHGVFVDWAYDHFGASALTTEIWKAPGETGQSAFDGQDEDLAMEWNDKELGGAGFINWTKYDHPEFGEIEIGGWNSNYFTQNPPPKFAEAEWKKNCLFELKRAELLPDIEIVDVKTEDLGDRLLKVTATIENVGYLPTNVTQKAIQNRIAKTVTVELELEGAELLFGKAKTDVGHIKGNAVQPAPTWRDRSFVDNTATAEWLIRLKGKKASANLKAVSQKAGTATKTVALQVK